MPCQTFGEIRTTKKNKFSLCLSLPDMAVSGKFSKCFILSCVHPSLVLYWQNSGGKYISYQIFLASTPAVEHNLSYLLTAQCNDELKR